MLTPLQYNRLCDELAELYAGLENSIIEDMTRRIVRMGYLSDASAWQARMLQEAGMLYDDILIEIAQRTGKTDREIRQLFRDAGVQSVRNDNFYYRQAGLVVPRNMSGSALQILNAGYQKCSGSLKNLTLTTANTSQQAFIQACNLAYLQTSSGMMDYQTAVRRAVQSAAGNGSVVRYPSGHIDKLDVAVRRAVLTGVGQTVRQLSFQNAKDMECDLMEVTAHAGARPSHAEWQGQIVSLSGRRGYLTPDDIGYGTVDGFGGVNCRHDWHPFFEGFSERAYSDERLQALKDHVIQIDGKDYHDYEVSQMQRTLERKIREKKRQVIAAQAMQRHVLSDADALAADEEFQQKSVQLKKAEQKLRDFLNQTGFLNDSSRTWVDGFGRSISQKAVWANRKVHKGLTSNKKNDKIKAKKSSGLNEKLKVLLTPEKYKTVSQDFFDSLPKIKNSETISQSLMAVNPNKHRWNCQRCVPVYELRRRGYNMTAPYASETDSLGFFGNFSKVFVNAEWIKCSGGGKQEIIDFLNSCNGNARVEISIKTSEGSHLFCAEKENGKIMFVDPQTGKNNVDNYFDKRIIEDTEFCRIDNLEFSNLIKDYIKEMES